MESCPTPEPAPATQDQSISELLDYSTHILQLTPDALNLEYQQQLALSHLPGHDVDRIKVALILALPDTRLHPFPCLPIT